MLLSASRVGPTGLAYGLDMTDEMLDLARRNQAEAGVTNVQWLRGNIEEIPLPADSVDVIISNCVINLSGDKPQVLREAARVLKPGGRFAVSDVIADPDMDDATRQDMQAYTGCIAGALTRDEFTEALHGGRPDRHHDHRDPPRPRRRGLGDRPRHQARHAPTRAAATAAAACCSTTEQASCCEPSEKSSCCSAEATAARQLRLPVAGPLSTSASRPTQVAPRGAVCQKRRCALGQEHGVCWMHRAWYVPSSDQARRSVRATAGRRALQGGSAAGGRQDSCQRSRRGAGGMTAARRARQLRRGLSLG